MPVFSFPDLPQPVCQMCPPVDELPSLKTVMDALCFTDFGKHNHYIIAENMLCLEVFAYIGPPAPSDWAVALTFL